jgi:hypothetical protein
MYAKNAPYAHIWNPGRLWPRGTVPDGSEVEESIRNEAGRRETSQKNKKR